MTQAQAAESQRQYYYSVLSKEEKDIYRYIPTVNGLLDFASSQYSVRPALSDGAISYTYRELSERVAVRRGQLKALGFKAGDKIAVYSANTIDAMELYLAIVTSGCISIMLPTSADGKALAFLCQKFDINGIFFDPALESGTSCVPVKTCSTEFIKYEPCEAAAVTKDTVCGICLTSGTTGIPKGAVMTHGAIMRGVLNGAYIPGGSLYKSSIAVLPLSHIFGLVYGFLARIFTGGTIYECRDVKRSLAMIPVLKPEILVLVPGLAEIVAALTKMKGKAFSESISALVIGGAPMSPKLTKALDALGLNTNAGYGLTECAGPAAANKFMAEKPESIGVLYPEQRARIVDGELRLKGDNIMLGYYGDEEITKAAFDEEGWFRTGDLARFDEEGFVYITGRIKNLIILDNGENVSPEEIEEIFYKENSVKDCLVKEDEMNGKAVIAIEILPFEPAVQGMTENQINEHFKKLTAEINRALPSFKQISKVTVRKEDFKRTSAMKIARN